LDTLPDFRLGSYLLCSSYVSARATTEVRAGRRVRIYCHLGTYPVFVSGLGLPLGRNEEGNVFIGYCSIIKLESYFLFFVLFSISIYIILNFECHVKKYFMFS